MIHAEFHSAVSADRLEKAIEAAPDRVRRGLADALTKAGIAHENIIKRNRFGPYTGEGYDDRLQRRSGALAAAYAMTAPTAAEPTMTLGIRKGMRGSVYAKVQEFGGTIRPKSGKFLTVPLKTALTPSGVLSGRFRIRKAADGYETDAGPTFIYESDGRAYVAIKQGKKGRVLPLYVLKRSVKIKPRFGFFGTWALLERKTLPALIARATARAVGGGNA